MIVQQGWKKIGERQVVAILVIAPCTNGMTGWCAQVGQYDPAQGETAQGIKDWEPLGAAGSIMTLIFNVISTEVAGWIDSQGTVIDLRALLESIREVARAIETTVEAKR